MARLAPQHILQRCPSGEALVVGLEALVRRHAPQLILGVRRRGRTLQLVLAGTERPGGRRLGFMRSS